MLKKSVVLFGVFFSLQLSAQQIDTTINSIRYLISEDTTSTIQNFLFTIQNQSNQNFQTPPFMWDQNKIVFHNLEGKRLGHDFILCGDFTPVSIMPDSSKTWQVKPYIHRPFAHTFITRNRQLPSLYSIYLVYWNINQKLIGPISYAIEKDLIKELYNKNQNKRDEAANSLRQLHEGGLGTTHPGHTFEHAEVFWQEKIISLKSGLSIEATERILEQDLTVEKKWIFSQHLIVQLDNAYQTELSFDIEKKLGNRNLSQVFRKAELLLPTNWTGPFRMYFVNGQVASDEKFKNGVPEGEQIYYRSNGKILQKKFYKQGILKSIRAYDPVGNYRSEITYKNGKPYRHTSFDKNGKAKRSWKYSNRKVKRTYN